MSRRAFAGAAATMGLGAAALATVGTKSVSAQAVTDVDILNFALNLEYLEAEFYTKSLTGNTIDDYGIGIDGVGNSGPTTGGRRIRFGNQTRPIIEEIAANERDHVAFLRAALGGAAVAKPAINLDALGMYNSDTKFLVLARAFEDVGVSAYGGAARLLQDPATLEAAARIALTEAYHAGNIRLIVTQKGIPTTTLDANDRTPPPSGDLYFPTSRVGLAKIRSASMVLAIVYGRRTSGTSQGGFFPNGMNGLITTV